MIRGIEITQIYILISIFVLLIITILIFFKTKNKKEKKMTELEAIAFVFILAGIIFGENRLLEYILFGIGILLAVIDIIIKIKKK